MQFVNFYFDEYKPKPLSFDFRFACVFLSLVICGLLLGGYLQERRLTSLKQSVTTRQEQLVSLEGKVKALREKLNASQNTENLEQQLIFYRKRNQQYQLALSKLNLKQQEENSISEILKALGERNPDALWLTEINISPHNLTLHGSTTKSGAIPIYIADLKNAAALNREFDELSIQRNPENKQLLDFILLNGRPTHRKDIPKEAQP